MQLIANKKVISADQESHFSKTTEPFLPDKKVISLVPIKSFTKVKATLAM